MARRNILAALVALLTTSLIGQASEAALLPPDALCSIAKLKASASAFRCAMRYRLKAPGGSILDSRCDESLVDRFSSAEARGGCRAIDDSGVAVYRASEGALSVLDVLSVDSATEGEARKCLKRKVKLVARYASCQTAALSRRFDASGLGEPADFLACHSRLEEKWADLDAAGTCATASESVEARRRSGLGYGFLHGARLESSSLVHAPLANAYLVDAEILNCRISYMDLNGADLSGAVLEDLYPHAQGVDARDARLVGASLTDVVFYGADLAGALFTGAAFNDVGGVGLVSCPASLPEGWACIANQIVGPTSILDGYTWSGHEVELSGADLSGFDLSNAWISTSNLRNAILNNANLSHAYIYNVDLTNALLTYTDLTSARLIVSELDGADMGGAELSSAEIATISAVGLVACPASLPSGWVCENSAIVRAD